LQDIELARISQEVTERFSSLLAVGDGGQRTLLVPLGADTSQQSFLTTPRHAWERPGRGYGHPARLLLG